MIFLYPSVYQSSEGAISSKIILTPFLIRSTGRAVPSDTPFWLPGDVPFERNFVANA